LYGVLWLRRKKEMAKAKKKWIKEAIKRPGAFTRKAEAAGMSVSRFVSKVERPGSAFSTRTKRQAALARTLAGLRKKKRK